MTGARGLLAVTGGTGFVGRRFVEEIRAAGWRVRLLSRGDDIGSGDEVRRFDLAADGRADPAMLERCDAVVHLAAYIPRNQADPGEADACWRANALGTLRLIEAAKAAGVSRLIQTSSANAYAPGLERPDENAPLFPVRRAPFYLSSKLVQEVFAHYQADSSFEVTTLRLSSVYGVGQRQGPVAAFAGALLAREEVRLAAGGAFGADFVEVGDVARALRLALERRLDGIYNVGSGCRSTMREIAESLADLTGAPRHLIRVEPGSEEAGAGFPALDIGKIEAAGHRPTPLRDGLGALVEWLRAS